MSKNEQRIQVGEFTTIYPRGKKGIWTADFQFDGQHTLVRGHQALGRVAGGAVGDRPGGAGVDIAVLLV